MNKKEVFKKLFQSPFILVVLLIALIALNSKGVVDFFITLGTTALVIAVGVIICIPITLGIYALIAKCVIKAAIALGKHTLGQVLGDAFKKISK